METPLVAYIRDGYIRGLRKEFKDNDSEGAALDEALRQLRLTTSIEQMMWIVTDFGDNSHVLAREQLVGFCQAYQIEEMKNENRIRQQGEDFAQRLRDEGAGVQGVIRVDVRDDKGKVWNNTILFLFQGEQLYFHMRAGDLGHGHLSRSPSRINTQGWIMNGFDNYLPEGWRGNLHAGPQ